jgi:hypothetical protein
VFGSSDAGTRPFRDRRDAGAKLSAAFHAYRGAHRLERVELELRLPRSFPDKYRGAVVAAANGCRVKKTLAAPPEITVVAR